MSLSPAPDDTHSRNHWYWRPGWKPGSRAWTVHITFEDQPGRERLWEAVRSLSAVRSRAGWDAIPLRWLHLTMQGIGFDHQVNDDQLDRLVRRAEQELATVGPLDLEMGPVLVDAEGVNLSVAHPELDGVRLAVRRALTHILVPVGEPEAWRPHVSVAYANTTGLHLEPVRNLLVETRLVVRVDHLSLIRLHRDHQMYEWDRVRRIRLT